MSPTRSRRVSSRRGRADRDALAIVLLLAVAANAANAATPATLPGIVVTGERELPGTPASIDRVEVESVPARELKSVSELLQRIPGVAARDRQNLAQDTQLSIRGFGARSAFGVRGLRIFQDGIPASMPDGQGQLSHILLEALAHVEVLRGPFSALYGNASGGVVEFFSADPPARPEFGAHAATGSDGLVQGNLWLAGPWRDAGAGDGYRVDVGHLHFAGFRDHSRARRDTRQARLLAGNASGTRIAVTADSLELTADDPQGLTYDEAIATPRAASAGALAFDTRKRVRQQQLGAHAEQDIGAHNTLWLNTWGGIRRTFQMLSIPVAAQQTPGSGGGVVDLDRHYAGADLRWRLDASLAQRPASLTVGVESQRSSEHRRGYENFIGDTLGVVGALRRDQHDTVRNHDVYAEARWDVLARWSATVGVRRSRVDFASRDAYIASGNPDDSGALHFAQTTPVAGLAWRANDALEFYGNAGRGFETPSFTELGYRADGGSGLNDSLRPAISRSMELGLRAHHGGHAFEAAAFESRTRDELVVASNLGGRSTYTNAASTRRTGLELSASGPFAATWRYAFAYGHLDARYRDGFVTCRAPPCATPDTRIDAGNRIPATAPDSLWAEVRWMPAADVDLFAQANAVGRVYADDANSAHAPGYVTLDVGVEHRWRLGRMAVESFARIDNLLDRRAIGSVIVNEGNERYFEPAPGRGWSVGLSLEPVVH